MLMRYVSSSSAAALVTATLLFVMAGLIAQQAGPRLSQRRVEFADFTFEPPPPVTVTRPTRPPEPDRLTDPPPPPVIGHETIDIAVRVGAPTAPEPPGRPAGPQPGIADGELLPIVQVSPHYPPSAERRGLEGYVIVMFTVTANGSVENVRVTESTHSVFERAAVDAAYKFRFRPRVIDGRPVAVDGVRRQVTFTLQDR